MGSYPMGDEVVQKFLNRKLFLKNILTFRRIGECKVHNRRDHSEVDCKVFLIRVSLVINKIISLNKASLSRKRTKRLIIENSDNLDMRRVDKVSKEKSGGDKLANLKFPIKDLISVQERK